MIKNNFIYGKRPAQAMAEFAIALPILLLLLYGILEAGRLLFLYSTVVTASRQAVRYGSATGEGNNGVFRYQDCSGIRSAANAVGYLGQFDTIDLAYDQGVTNANPPVPINRTTYCSSTTDSSLNSTILQGNRTRLVVTVRERFYPLVRLVPFLERDITATSARTILYSVPIVVEQPEQEWFKVPTETLIISHDPNPSEIEQWVTVTVDVNNLGGGAGEPTGIVHITGADENCDITLSGGTGSCNIRFDTAGTKTITAFYEGDADHLASSGDASHEVTVWRTVIEILSDQPDFSLVDQDFIVIVKVTGGRIDPGGTVEVDGGQGVRCTITLSNGVGNCTLSYNNAGSKTLSASYNGDSMHLPSGPVTEPHQVLVATPTPTRTSTPTLVPTATTIPPTPTITPSPTIIPSPVAGGCDLVTHGPISIAGGVLSMTISNPYPFSLVMQDVTVTWNDDKGHLFGNKQLFLQRMSVGSTTVWTGNINNQSTYTIPTTAIIPTGITTITFYFHQTYDNIDGTEAILINLSTPGCENDPIGSDQP